MGKNKGSIIPRWGALLLPPPPGRSNMLTAPTNVRSPSSRPENGGLTDVIAVWGDGAGAFGVLAIVIGLSSAVGPVAAGLVITAVLSVGREVQKTPTQGFPYIAGVPV